VPGWYTPSSHTVPSAGDLSGRPGPSDSLQGRHINGTFLSEITVITAEINPNNKPYSKWVGKADLEN